MLRNTLITPNSSLRARFKTNFAVRSLCPKVEFDVRLGAGHTRAQPGYVSLTKLAGALRLPAIPGLIAGKLPSMSVRE